MLNEILYGIPNFTKKEAVEVKICVLDKIDIITENNTTNPPIVRIVEIDFLMAFPKISPKFDTLTKSVLFDW